MNNASTRLGTVLLISVVVISGATAAAIAFELISETSEPAPSAALDVSITEKGNVTVTHSGGDSIPAGETEIIGLAAGETLNEQLSAGDTVNAGKVSPDVGVVRVVVGGTLFATKPVPALGALNISITNTNSPVDEGNDLTVTAEITNQGTATVTDEIALQIRDSNDNLVEDPADNTSVSLAPNESTTETLVWGTESGDDGTYTAIVRGDKTIAVEPVTVQDNSGSGGSSGGTGGIGGIGGIPAFNIPALIVPMVVSLLAGLRYGLFAAGSRDKRSGEESPESHDGQQRGHNDKQESSTELSGPDGGEPGPDESKASDRETDEQRS